MDTSAIGISRQAAELSLCRENCADLSEKLALATTMLQERDVLHKDRLSSVMSKAVGLEFSNNELSQKLESMVKKEVVRAEGREAFRRDVQDLERAVKMLSEREREVQIKEEDMDRTVKRLQRQISHREAESNRLKDDFTNKHRELESFKETSARKYEDLKLELDRSVSRAEFEHVKERAVKLQARINTDMVSIESIGKQNAEMEMLKRRIKEDYVPRIEYDRLLSQKELMEETVKVIEDTLGRSSSGSKEAAERSSSLERRLARSEKELENARALISDLTHIDAMHKKCALESDETIQKLTMKLIELETNKASLLTQIGKIKLHSKFEHEEAVAAHTTKKQSDERLQILMRQNEDLSMQLRDKSARLHLADERNQSLEGMTSKLKTDTTEKERTMDSQVTENKMLTMSVQDLTTRTKQLESYHTAKDKESAFSAVEAIARRYTEQMDGGEEGGRRGAQAGSMASISAVPSPVFTASTSVYMFESELELSAPMLHSPKVVDNLDTACSE